MLLLRSNAERDPVKVLDFLFFELEVAVEDSKVELAIEGRFVQFNLMDVKRIIERALVSIGLRLGGVIVASITEEVAIRLDGLQASLDLLDVLAAAQVGVSLRIEHAQAREEFVAVVAAQLSAEGMDCNIDAAAIGFELEDLAHDGGCFATEGLAEPVEVLQISLPQGEPNQLDVHLFEILMLQARDEIGSERCV